MAQIISGTITGIISLVLYIYVSFTARGKGPILTNEYLLATEEERQKLDIKAEYHLVTTIFLCVATMFLFLTVYIFTNWMWSMYIFFLSLVIVFIYTIVQSVKSVKSETKK